MKTKLKVGDKLYKYQGFNGVAEYICQAVIQRNKITEYEIECQNCQHGEACLVLVKQAADSDCFEYMATLNDDTGEYDAWHNDYQIKHERYYKTKSEARIKVYEHYINECDAEIRRLNDKIDSQKKRKEEVQGHLNNILEATNEA